MRMYHTVDTSALNQWSSDWLYARIDEIAEREAESLVAFGVCDREHVKTENLRDNALKAWLEAAYPAGNA